MKDRTTSITLDGKPRPIFCDNAAILRYERAGGSLVGYEANPIGNTCVFLRANLADPSDREEFPTDEDVINALEAFRPAAAVVEGILTGSTFYSATGEKKSGGSGASGGSGRKASSDGDSGLTITGD